MVDLQDIGVSQDIMGDITRTQVKHYSRKRIDTILKASETRLDAAQKHNNEDFDSAIWFTPHFSSGDYVHLD